MEILSNSVLEENIQFDNFCWVAGNLMNNSFMISMKFPFLHSINLVENLRFLIL